MKDSNWNEEEIRKWRAIIIGINWKPYDMKENYPMKVNDIRKPDQILLDDRSDENDVWKPVIHWPEVLTNLDERETLVATIEMTN